MTSQETISSKATQWLQEEGFVWEEVRQSGFSHFYVAHNPSAPANKVTVSQLANDEKLIVAMGISLDEAVQEQIGRLPLQRQLEMKKGLLKLLYRSPNSFKMNEEGGLKSVSLFQPIYPDGQTKDRFMSVINDLHKTQALIMLWLDDSIPATPERKVAPRPTVAPVPPPMPAVETCPNCRNQLKPGAKFCATCGTKLGFSSAGKP